MMTHRPQLTFRTRTHDALTPRRVTRTEPGKIQPGKIGVYRGDFLVGQCGPKATELTALRFGARDAKLGRRNGAPAWIGR